MSPTLRSARMASGRPLVALAGLLACWVAARIALWQVPAPPTAYRLPPASLFRTAPQPRPPSALLVERRAPLIKPRLVATLLANSARTRDNGPSQSNFEALNAFPVKVRDPLPVFEERAIQPEGARPPRLGETGSSPSAVSAGDVSLPARALPARRWSGDAWVALRDGGGLFGGEVFGPTYGASQAGAVLRYDLVPGARHRPAAYTRAVQALGAARDTDLAAGISVRLLPGLPLTAHAEARASRRAGAVTVRPAAFVTAGIDDVPLPLGIRGRGYVQGGYLGGPDATAFADGSGVAERKLLSRGKTMLGAGAGVWGGAQRGAARFDLGPSASLRFPLGEGSARLTLDYRLRAAGQAAPASGAALTLAAGF